jgi:hypothetical protein
MSKRLEFTPATKKADYERRGGICGGLVELKMSCDQPIAEYDHIKRNKLEPDNSLENCRGLCLLHHKIKTRLDKAADKHSRHVLKQTKKSQKPKARIRSAGFPSPEKRQELKQRHAAWLKERDVR